MTSSIIRSLRTSASAVLIAAVCTGLAGAQDTILTKHGAEIDARLLTTINTKTAKNGDPFALKVVDLMFNKRPELKGSTIEGHLENISAAGPTHKASLNVIFDDIKFADGRTEPIAVAVKNMSDLSPKTHHVRDMGIIVGSAVVGHVTSKKTGHNGGTMAGAAAGFAIVSAMKSDIVLKPGTVLKLKLQKDLPQPA